MPSKIKCFTKKTNEGKNYTTCVKGDKQLREDAADKEAKKYIVPKKKVSPPAPQPKYAFKKLEEAVKGKAKKVSAPERKASMPTKIAPKPRKTALQAKAIPKTEGDADGELNAYILSYKGNEVMATRLERQLKERGFPHVRIVYAPDMAESGMARNKVVFHTFRKYLLPLLEASKRNNIVFEDDADVYSPYSVYKKLADKWPMNRISQWGSLNKLKGIPQFVVGSTIVSYKKSFIPRLAAQMRKDREQHIDGWLTKKFKFKEEWDVEPNKGYGGTISHHSYILGNSFRPGLLGSDAPKGYDIPAIEAGFKRGVKAEGDDKPKQVRKKKVV